jgi:hypothetical protein
MAYNNSEKFLLENIIKNKLGVYTESSSDSGSCSGLLSITLLPL